MVAAVSQDILVATVPPLSCFCVDFSRRSLCRSVLGFVSPSLAVSLQAVASALSVTLSCPPSGGAML